MRALARESRQTLGNRPAPRPRTRVPREAYASETVLIMNDRAAPSPVLGSLVSPPRTKAYDVGAWLYDLIVASPLYHRGVWSMEPTRHAEFAQHALDTTAEGPILDAGCGSLLFTAPCYRMGTRARELTLLDGSAGMLTRARRRLGSTEANWVQADLRALPFEADAFSTVLHFGVLHCLDEAALVLSEISRVLRPNGKLFLSCLTLASRRGDAFLRRLARSGHVAAPRTPEHVLKLVQQAGFVVHRCCQRGSFLFVEGARAAPV